MAEIKEYIHEHTLGRIEADDKSMYRALRRFNSADLITSKTVTNSAGPDIKIWRLTNTGEWVLTQFIERHIQGVLLAPQNKKLFE